MSSSTNVQTVVSERQAGGEEAYVFPADGTKPDEFQYANFNPQRGTQFDRSQGRRCASAAARIVDGGVSASLLKRNACDKNQS